jgi:S-adenosylmethionine-diacylgycerolhomoserine-N-methlytransferase
MIPDWRAAIRNAYRMLKPGGHIAVCDFTVSEKQWWGMASLWTWIFSNDHVHLRKEHIPTLQAAFEEVTCKVDFGTFPYVPSTLKCPYYYFVGKKVDEQCKI